MDEKYWIDDYPILKRFIIILVVSIILFLAWLLFLSIVKSPPLETTPAMIMIWISFAVILFTFFPSLLNKIKKIKIKDFELELQKSVTKATARDYITISDGPTYYVAEKSNFKNFVNLFTLAKKSPERPILLLINLRNDRYISIPALFIYLFFVDLFNSNVICLFISSRSRNIEWDELKKEEIIGVGNGKKILQSLTNQFPNLFRIINQGDLPNLEEINLFNVERLSNYFRIMYEQSKERFRDNEFLSREDANNLFANNLYDEEINYEVENRDKKTILDAIIRDVEYLIVFKNNSLYSIIPLQLLTKDISEKVLNEILRDKDSGA